MSSPTIRRVASLVPWAALALAVALAAAPDLGAQGMPHGLAPADADCTRCHDPQDFATIVRDNVHQDTRFPLDGEHARLECAACHDVQTGFGNLAGECALCHKQREAHRRLVGDDCAACHTPRGWLPNRFRHVQTGFPLTGAHRAVNCEDCHAAGFQAVPTDCGYCHEAAFRHEGNEAHATPGAVMSCDLCHDTHGWEHVRYPH